MFKQERAIKGVPSVPEYKERVAAWSVLLVPRDYRFDSNVPLIIWGFINDSTVN